MSYENIFDLEKSVGIYILTPKTRLFLGVFYVFF
jgi:hypothetical protein